MKIIKWSGIILGIVVLSLAVFLAYMGMFSSLNVMEKDMGPFTIVFESYKGDYRETGNIFKRVNDKLLSDGITSTRGIGIYYDDPRKVARDDRRSDCGIVIDDKDTARLREMKDRYRIKTLDRKLSMAAEFPMKNNLSMMIGPMKGYPALMNHAAARRYKTAIPYEYYMMAENKIFYVMPIEK